MEGRLVLGWMLNDEPPNARDEIASTGPDYTKGRLDFGEGKSISFEYNNVYRVSDPRIKSAVRYEWHAGKQGIFIRCEMCGILFGFDGKIRTSGFAHPHKDPESAWGAIRPCYRCPNCERSFQPYFMGWRQYLEEQKKGETDGS